MKIKDLVEGETYMYQSLLTQACDAAKVVFKEYDSLCDVYHFQWYYGNKSIVVLDKDEVVTLIHSKPKEDEMEEFNVVEYCEQETNSTGDVMFKQAYELLKNAKVTYGFQTKTHEFSNGPCQVAKELVIVINLDKVEFPIQPHADFVDDACGHMVEFVVQQVSGMLENVEG